MDRMLSIIQTYSLTDEEIPFNLFSDIDLDNIAPQVLENRQRMTSALAELYFHIETREQLSLNLAREVIAREISAHLRALINDTSLDYIFDKH